MSVNLKYELKPGGLPQWSKRTSKGGKSTIQGEKTHLREIPRHFYRTSCRAKVNACDVMLSFGLQHMAVRRDGIIQFQSENKERHRSDTKGICHEEHMDTTRVENRTSKSNGK